MNFLERDNALLWFVPPPVSFQSAITPYFLIVDNLSDFCNYSRIRAIRSAGSSEPTSTFQVRTSSPCFGIAVAENDPARWLMGFHSPVGGSQLSTSIIIAPKGAAITLERRELRNASIASYLC